jgi:hypothetical protein
MRVMACGREGREGKGEDSEREERAYHPEDVGRAVLEDEKDEQVVELVEDQVAGHEGGGIGVALVVVALAVVLIVFALFG